MIARGLPMVRLAFLPRQRVTMIHEHQLIQDGEPHGSFQAVITVDGDPGAIERAAGLLGLSQAPTFACRPLGSEGSRLVLSVPDGTEGEARRAIQAVAGAINHVLAAPNALGEAGPNLTAGS
jgi:hypothetical protein